MSQHLNNMKLGDTIMMKGPKGHLDYKGKGNFTIAHKRDNVEKYKKKKIGMVAGGTGITPMLQGIQEQFSISLLNFFFFLHIILYISRLPFMKIKI
jgi:ferredoxin-NADP reductase